MTHLHDPKPPPKSKGVGTMTSAYVDSYRGMGIPLELISANDFRETKGRASLTSLQAYVISAMGRTKRDIGRMRNFVHRLKM
jgi:hypothetical protein